MAQTQAKISETKSFIFIYVRNYSGEGTFAAVERDLERIRDLGTDIIWLMPVHPLGVKNRKGSLGSPYAIRNYREINRNSARFRISVAGGPDSRAGNEVYDRRGL